MRDQYLPSQFTSEEYPGLVEGEAVETIAVGAVMAVFNWQPDTWRYQKVERFVGRFFEHFDELQRPPRHSKWREVNLATELPGWTRFPPAAAWLKAHPGSRQSAKQAAFDRFLDGSGNTGALSEEDKTRLFREFLDWQRQRNAS